MTETTMVTEPEHVKAKRIARAALIDKAMNKIISRRLLVWIIATIALFVGKADAQSWMAVSMAFIGSETFINTALAWKKGSTNDSATTTDKSI